MAPERHMAHFKMLEAIQAAKGCPLCRLDARAVRSYLESVLYESVNDSSVRAALMRSKGYCRAHAQELLEFRDGLGTAVIYQDMVRDFLSILAASGEITNRFARRELRPWLEHPDCPACRVRDEARNRHVSTLVEGLADPELQMALEKSPGLCIPHFFFVQEILRDREIRGFLVRAHRAKYGQLLGELEEFCRKNDYRRIREAAGPEGDSWQRAVNLVAGEG